MSEFSHKKADGSLHMVNVGGKDATLRKAVAQGRIDLKTAYKSVKNDECQKGSVIECARIAGILAAKQTGQLIPLCHPLNLNVVNIEFEYQEPELIVTARAECDGKTGVEMEALTAVSLACLTIYDMAKSIDKNMEILGIKLLSKEGGKSGKWTKSP